MEKSSQHVLGEFFPFVYFSEVFRHSRTSIHHHEHQQSFSSFSGFVQPWTPTNTAGKLQKSTETERTRRVGYLSFFPGFYFVIVTKIQQFQIWILSILSSFFPWYKTTSLVKCTLKGPFSQLHQECTVYRCSNRTFAKRHPATEELICCWFWNFTRVK